MRRLLRIAIRRQGARNTFCRLNGITNPQDVSSFIHGKIDRAPRKAYEALGFLAPNYIDAPRLQMMWAALKRVNARAKIADGVES